jgi:hypothetical protein
MTEHQSFIENLPKFRGDSQWGDRAIDEILRLRAALEELVEAHDYWFSTGKGEGRAITATAKAKELLS